MAALRDEITAKQQQIEDLTDENQKRAVTEEQLKAEYEKLKTEVAEKVKDEIFIFCLFVILTDFKSEVGL